VALKTTLIQCDWCETIDDRQYETQEELDETDWIFLREHGEENTFCDIDCLQLHLTN
jgi:hypothetical protein